MERTEEICQMAMTAAHGLSKGLWDYVKDLKLSQDDEALLFVESFNMFVTSTLYEISKDIQDHERLFNVIRQVFEAANSEEVRKRVN